MLLENLLFVKETKIANKFKTFHSSKFCIEKLYCCVYPNTTTQNLTKTNLILKMNFIQIIIQDISIIDQSVKERCVP